jgi:small subunit ribosomal protein S16
MAVKLRLKRVGRRHRPAYRLAAVDGRRTRDTRVIEELGNIDPLNPGLGHSTQFNRERIEYWLGVGAQPSETVRSYLSKQGIVVPSRKAKKPRK